MEVTFATFVFLETDFLNVSEVGLKLAMEAEDDLALVWITALLPVYFYVYGYFVVYVEVIRVCQIP